MTNQELEKIYYEAYRPVYWTAMSLLKNEADAEDITQETFITLIKSYDTIKDKSKVVSFLKKTAANKCLDKIKLTKTVNMEDEFFENVEDVPENFLPDSYLESEDTRKVIMDIINNTLSDDVRRTIILYYYDEMSVKEISEVLSVPQGTILWRLSFARKKIKKEVEKYENDNDTRLFAMGLPFLTRLFYTEAEQVQIKPMPASLSAILSASNMNPALGAGINTAAASSVKAGAKAASTAVKKGTDSMIKRIIIAIMVGLLVGGAASVILNKTVFKKDTSNNGISKISVTDKEGTTETGVSDTTVSEPDNSGSSDVAPKNTAAPTETTAPAGLTADNKFGSYNGEPIEWIVLEEDDQSVLLISKYALAIRAYNNVKENTDWEHCTLRQWLNGEFYDLAFSAEEKDLIITSEVKNPNNAQKGSKGGNDTEDKVFVLSLDEAEQYFSSDEERKAEYVRTNMHPSSKALWWLRSPGYNNKDAAFVYETGMIEYSGIVVNEEDNIGVRPVIRMVKDAGTVTPDNTEPTTQPTEPSTTDASPSNGKEVVFGKYEGTDFEWIIIAEDDEGYLLISKYILDPMPYNNKTEKVNWETCSLRKWLNGEFYEETFNDSEKAQILTTLNSNPGNPDYNVTGGNDTQDNVFLLSVDEAEQYFSSDDARKATYRRNPSNEGYWWLRSVGYSDYAAAFVFGLGSISPSGYGASESENIGVRPVIRVKKDALNVTPNNGGTNADTDPDLIGTWYYENGGETLYMTFQEDGTVYQKKEKNGVVKQSETATYVIIEKGVIAFIQNGNELERDDYKIEGDKLTMQEQNHSGKVTLARVR